MSDPQSPEVEAWKRFCQRIEALGERILEDDFPNAPRDRTEGIAHLADQVSCWLGWAIPHGDPATPFFHRSNDLFTQWGGPNQDNAYHHARVEPGRRYRIAGRMQSCEHFVITFRVGFMHMKEWGTKASITSVERGIEPGDDFEILVGGDGSDPDFFPIPDGVTTLSLREYYVDVGIWEKQSWAGGYELGISFPPDWVGNFLFNAQDEEVDGTFERSMVTNYESLFGTTLIDTVVYEETGARTLSSLPPKLMVVG